MDEQQVNLTRFNLFFPEKREFFLEGRGIFDFARGGVAGGFGGALRRSGGGGGFFGGGNAPSLFYSRRIGLQSGSVVPILGGGRVTGKIGAFDVGALNIQADAEEVSGAEMTNFTVVRVKRDILRRSTVGGLFTNRSVSLVGDGASQAYGADATFSFYENVSMLAYLARTKTPGRDGRVDDWRGGSRRMRVAVPGGFRNAGASLPAVAPFPVAAHRTGQAGFPHPALGRDHAFAHGRLAVRGPRGDVPDAVELELM